jgi:hypothetical protein
MQLSSSSKSHYLVVVRAIKLQSKTLQGGGGVGFAVIRMQSTRKTPVENHYFTSSACLQNTAYTSPTTTVSTFLHFLLSALKLLL